MADDSLDVKEKLQYHPTDTPRGMLYYELDELTSDQQIKLNELKIHTVREDEKYLAAHPEIRAIVILLLRQVFRKRPMIKLHEFMARFFNRPEEDIQEDINVYLKSRSDNISESSAELVTAKKPDEEVEEESEPSIDRPSDFVCGEHCTCDYAKAFPNYDHFSFFSETEHWITPQSSSVSVDMDDSPEGEVDAGGGVDLTKVINIISMDDDENEKPETTTQASEILSVRAQESASVQNVETLPPSVTVSEQISEDFGGEKKRVQIGLIERRTM